ncbi:SMC5-SMC6 complex localization factor protein 1 [Indicator indicator]|uniref:SMC5-SMC6 complex localization factor protein 1 n=1 Tax=Indicator indicator TaxID=1002788 RepID=UPI0023DF6C68|nr:SMC5-SMC6 complex localization factor protein 1 [Indicator indicator]
MASGGQKRILQLTGFRKKEKETLLEYLFKLDCVFLDNKQYRNCSHLIAKKLCKSEKFLAACAAGKWILTKEYIINSAESGRWLDETTYEWGYEIEKDTHHYSPQRQSAPKRWREELARSGAPGAFHRWKVLLLAEEDNKQMMSIRRVLEAGKATICSSQNSEHNITHVFVSSTICLTQTRKYLSDGPYYPLQHIGDYLFENEIQNLEDTPVDDVPGVQEADKIVSDMQLAKVRNAVIRHIYFAAAVKHSFAQKDYLKKCSPEVESASLSRGTCRLLEGLVEECLIPDVITELAACQKYFTPPVKILHSLLEYIFLENTNAIFIAKFFHILYLVLQLDPPWKSPSMLKYYLDLLQCPVCKKGTWSLIEMLVRSCLYCKPSCHEVPIPGREDEQRMVHKTFLKFFVDLIKAEVEFLTTGLVEGTSSQHPQVMPQTVLLKTFWLEGKTSVLFTKHVNILADWIILSQRELSRKNDAFRCEIVFLLNAILGTIVEYWIISGLLMDRNVFHQVADDLAHYFAISCNDFSICNLKTFICSMSSPWLQMFVAEAVFKNLCLQKNITISKAPLSLQKIVCCYLPALREVGMHKTREVQKTESKEGKRGRCLCPESPSILQMPSSDKQNQVKVLPDLPDLNKCPSLMKTGPKAKTVNVEHKENCYRLPKNVNIWKRNLKGETALHIACRNNKVERLIQLLSSPGIDINVKDYAGWTPLHEACNHGSTVCVREILQRCPEVDLLSQVDGMTPLHDALSNGHVEIAKLLLQHGGECISPKEKKKKEGVKKGEIVH